MKLFKNFLAAAVLAAALFNSSGNLTSSAATGASAEVLPVKETAYKLYDFPNRALEAVDDGGNVFYSYYDPKNESGHLLKTDAKNSIIGHAEFYFPSMSDGQRFKITDKSVFLIYSEHKITERNKTVPYLKCLKFDRNLKYRGIYDFTSLTTITALIDVTDNKVCYATTGAGDSWQHGMASAPGQLYVTDFGMKKKTKLMELEPDAESKGGKPTQFRSVAITDKYAGFMADGGHITIVGPTRHLVTENYYGTVDLETKTSDLNRKDDVYSVKAFADRLLWTNSRPMAFLDESFAELFPAPEKEEIVIFEDGDYIKFETRTSSVYSNLGIKEGQDPVIDENGGVITVWSDGSYSNAYMFRVYENGECVKEFSKNLNGGLESFAANNGRIMANAKEYGGEFGGYSYAGTKPDAAAAPIKPKTTTYAFAY